MPPYTHAPTLAKDNMSHTPNRRRHSLNEHNKCCNKTPQQCQKSHHFNSRSKNHVGGSEKRKLTGKELQRHRPQPSGVLSFVCLIFLSVWSAMSIFQSSQDRALNQFLVSYTRESDDAVHAKVFRFFQDDETQGDTIVDLDVDDDLYFMWMNLPLRPQQGASSNDHWRFLDSSTSTRVPFRPDRRILHIHIGKCGGTSVEQLLYRRDCLRGIRQWKKNSTKRQDCLSFNKTVVPAEHQESEISVHTHHDIHIKLEEGDENATATFDTYLYELRHPVERAISAYYFLHYNNANQSDFAKIQHPVKDLFYKACFPTLEEFDQAIHDGIAESNSSPPKSFLDRNVGTTTTTSNNNTNDITWVECQHLALEILLDGAPDRVGYDVNIHMTYGFQFYQRRGGDNTDNKDIFVIRIEHLWSDMALP